jgi:type III restriction enzyme
MKAISLADLLPFQKRASSELVVMIQEYPSERFKVRYDSETGEIVPFLCRLKAITGAGKTPILCYAASLLAQGIILWTTNRGAVVSQTWANLQPEGKYGQILPSGTSISFLADMSPSDWDAMIHAPSGLTILLATVASFNQEGDELRIHRRHGDLTRWEMLGDMGLTTRKRPLYVFYDEGHGATQQQFERLRELKPKAFVLASASPLSGSLTDLLPGKTGEDKERSLWERTVVIPTQKVVEAGLLKKRLYLMDCDTTQADIVNETQRKWAALATKLAPLGYTPLACFIVNETERGVDIWEHLVRLGVSKSHIAVHLYGAADVMRERHGSLLGMIDTYSGKRSEQRSPQFLRSQEYTHLIWNMTLREGWDEPFAYVAYIDDRGRSITDMVQKIGRFLRQPNATPFDDPDLNAAYFYLKVTNGDFARLVRETQEELETEGYEIISTSQMKVPSSRTVEVLRPQSVSKISPWFGESVEERDQILLQNIPLYAEKARQATGVIHIRVIDMSQIEEDEGQRRELQREHNDITTPWKYLSARLARIDSRLVNETGNIFSPEIQAHEAMTQEIQYNSPAMQAIDGALERIQQQLNEKLELVSEGPYDVFTIKPFKLISPDITGVSDIHRERYKVRRYKHAVHAEYNGMNPFETQVADALDLLGNVWCRNPSGPNGYKIPAPSLGAESIWFYPDFLLWTEKEVWAIDPKGRHLFEAAVQSKLLDLTIQNNPTVPVRVALILEGGYQRKEVWSKTGKKGKEEYTLIRKVGVDIKTLPFPDLTSLVHQLVGR